jgi:signal transduction histidine kinase
MSRNRQADREVLDKLLSTVRGSIKSLRHLIFELRPHVLDQDGLAPALREYLESLDADFEFSLEQRLKEEPDAELRVLLYRVAQEALTNIRKHAHARRVSVLLVERDGGFLIRITDDGVGVHGAGDLAVRARSSRALDDARAGRDGRRLVPLDQFARRRHDRGDLGPRIRTTAAEAS